MEIMREKLLRQLITKYRGASEAEYYFSYSLKNIEPLANTARQFMSTIPPSFGACAQMSACWAGYLREHHSIPAIVVAGDLKINGTRVFKCKENLPDAKKTGKIISGKWKGHCWIEIDGYIGDLSIFRTAYAITGPSVLKDYIASNFGFGRGAIISPSKELPEGMQYDPKYVLKDNQINSLISGMSYQIENGIAQWM